MFNNRRFNFITSKSGVKFLRWSVLPTAFTPDQDLVRSKVSKPFWVKIEICLKIDI